MHAASTNVRMNIEIRQFASRYSLSDREVDVLMMLLNRVTSTGEISDQLKLSPNTVSNHLKSILAKTNTNSKTDLLSAFVQHTYSMLYPYQVYARHPRVLVIDDEQEICQLFFSELEYRGVKVQCETKPDNIIERIAEFDPDVVVLDIMLPGSDGLKVLQQIRSHSTTTPKVILISGSLQYTRRSCIEAGACDLFAKPFDINQILFVIIEQFIDNTFVRSRFVRVDTEIDIAIGQSRVAAQIKNLAYGGAFVSADANVIIGSGIEAGNVIPVRFELPSFGVIEAKCEVMWARQRNSLHSPAGWGIKFADLSFEQDCAIRDYVRSQKKLSYLPNTEKVPIRTAR